MRWNPEIEDFFDELLSDEVNRFTEGVQRFEFDLYLGVYPDENFAKWCNLSMHVTESVLATLEPVGKKISAVYDTGVTGGVDSSKSHKPFYSSIPKLKTALSPQETTQLNFDKSTILLELIQKHYKEKPTEILGEVQFSFICFLLSESFDGFEQWKQIVNLLCSSDQALFVMPDLFCDFIEVLHFQLMQAPEDFFVDVISHNNFLDHALNSFFQLLDDPKLDSKLLQRSAKFRQYTEKRFGKTFTSELESGYEDAPVVISEPELQ